MPASVFLDYLGTDEPVEASIRLARRFKVSEEAAAIRLHQLGRLDLDGLNRIRQETRERVERQQGERSPIVPYSTRRLRDLGRSYVGAVLDAYYDERLTLTDVSQYLDVKVAHIEKMEEALHGLRGQPHDRRQ